jgi:hypothetical protein
LFVEAVNRWGIHETAANDRRGSSSTPDGPTLFDLANPLELRVEASAADIDPKDEAGVREHDASEERDVQAKVDDITAELVRLLEQAGAPAENKDAPDNSLAHPVRKAE